MCLQDTWENAVAACNRLSVGSRLAILDTLAKHKAATVYIGSEGSTRTDYWIGAKYDVSKGNFEWNDGTEIDSSWAPWDRNQPSKEVDGSHRLAFRSLNRNTASWISFQNSTANRYLCETSGH
jgi:hypothetical protein